MICAVAAPSSWTGRRVVVLGACTDVIGRLVALGAEVHVVAPDAVGVVGIASITREDPMSESGLTRAAARIGAVVDVLHICTGETRETGETGETDEPAVDVAAIFARCFAAHSVVHTGAVA